MMFLLDVKTLEETPDLARSSEFFRLLDSSYKRYIGSSLVPAGGALWLYHHAPFAVVAHDTDPDPRFIYANRTAQTCFEYSWEEFTGLRSRFSAEAPDRAEGRAARRARVISEHPTS